MTPLEKFCKTTALKSLRTIAEDYGGNKTINELIYELENKLTMIDENKINAAAAAYANETWNNDEDQFMCMHGFKAGAEWAQQEFVKSLWHDAKKKPMASCHVIALSKKGMFVYDFQFKEDDDNWARKFQLLHIERWAYLDDILPKEGDEE